MIKINVIVEDKNWLKIIKNPEKYFKQQSKKIEKVKFFCLKKNYFFSIMLSNSKKIKILNKKFRKKNKTTDVLSFPHYNKKELKKNIFKNKDIYLGDIIINLQKISYRLNKEKFFERFNELWIHALLHLFGFKHRKNKDYKKMNFLEKKLLKTVYKNA